VKLGVEMQFLFMVWLAGWDIKDGGFGFFGVSARKLLKGFSMVVFWREGT
jgi:hypothetical protein